MVYGWYGISSQDRAYCENSHGTDGLFSVTAKINKAQAQWHEN
jgi:hypothetical protein